jgi:hypothetical protein
MPLLFYLVLINVLVRVVGGAVRKAREPKPEPLCTRCVFAHMQYAANGKRAISCTFGGVVRPMTLDVMYCTDYRDRYAPVRLVAVGFAGAMQDAEPVAEVATAGR